MSENNGELPAEYERLAEIPGVGPYTAGAIASIAFGEDVPAVDGNARRVLSRLLGVWDDVRSSAGKRRLQHLAAELLPHGRSGAFNEGLMELGATVCTPADPRCPGCPLSCYCYAFGQGKQEVLPVRTPRGATPHNDVAAAVTKRDDGLVLVTKRNLSGMLGGLWGFPAGTCAEGEELRRCLVRGIKEELGITVEVGDQLTVVEHAYSHFRMTLHAFWCSLVRSEPKSLRCAAVRWVPPTGLDELPMSVADRKVAQALVGQLGSRNRRNDT